MTMEKVLVNVVEGEGSRIICVMVQIFVMPCS